MLFDLEPDHSCLQTTRKRWHSTGGLSERRGASLDATTADISCSFTPDEISPDQDDADMDYFILSRKCEPL